MADKTDQTKSAYTAISSKLDDVIAKLQDPDVSIDDAVLYYEEAMKLIKRLEQHLGDAENRIEKIKAKFEEV